MGRKVLQIRQRLTTLSPNNKQYQEQLKNATAEAAMDEGGWEKVFAEDGDYRSLIKNKDEAVQIEQSERTFKDEDAVENLIESTLAEIEEADTVEKLHEIITWKIRKIKNVRSTYTLKINERR